MKARILIGIPMSGKSTFAKELMLEMRGEAVIINCDGIRQMLTGESNKFKAFKKENECLVWSIFNTLVSEAIVNKKDMIIDNTNLNIDIFKKLISKLENRNVEIEFTIINTPLSVCMARLITEFKEDANNKLINSLVNKDAQKGEILKYLKDKFGYESELNMSEIITYRPIKKIESFEILKNGWNSSFIRK